MRKAISRVGQVSASVACRPQAGATASAQRKSAVRVSHEVIGAIDTTGDARRSTSSGLFDHNEVEPGHFGGHKDMPGPLAIVVDHRDQVWVTSTNHYLHQFSATGEFVQRVGGTGTESGQFDLPHGLAFDSEHSLSVADSRNSRIQKFAL